MKNKLKDLRGQRCNHMLMTYPLGKFQIGRREKKAEIPGEKITIKDTNLHTQERQHIQCKINSKRPTMKHIKAKRQREGENLESSKKKATYLIQLIFSKHKNLFHIRYQEDQKVVK